LPKTFREAVLVANSLGVNYIWIDSLCILQDSDVDWKAESSMMDTIYGNALCNIAATASENATHGLFRRRDSFWPFQTIVRSSYDNFLKENIVISKYQEVSDESMAVDGPLLNRAWVVQERVMAKRILHFGNTQIYWECFHKVASEMWPHVIETRFMYEYSTHTSFGDSAFKKKIRRLDSDVGPIDTSALLKDWKTLVEEYTKCNVSFERDN
jgi:hypothetical protein